MRNSQCQMPEAPANSSLLPWPRRLARFRPGRLSPDRLLERRPSTVRDVRERESLHLGLAERPADAHADELLEEVVEETAAGLEGKEVEVDPVVPLDPAVRVVAPPREAAGEGERVRVEA